MKLEFSPLGGLNTYDNYARLGPTEVEDSRNLLFEKKKAFNRPGLGEPVALPVLTNLAFGENVVDNAVSYNMLIDTLNNIYHYPGAQITAASTSASFGPKQYNNATACIGVILLGNNPGGIVYWDPSAGNTYNVISSAPYRYVASHQGRAIAAFQLTGGSTLVNSRMFAWSKPGDTTVWTSLDGSAGQLAIAECNDEVTGLGVLHNVVVIPRRFGIHIAYATGTLPLPYNVQPFIQKGAGCFFPSTSAFSDEMYFFVSEENVYSFDLTKVSPIGGPIRDKLLFDLGAGIGYRGFVSRQQEGSMPRLRYNLFPLNSFNSPHYIYDIEDGTWSQHFYSTPAAWAWNAAVLAGTFDWGISFADTQSPPSLHYWQNGILCEQAASFTRYIGVMEAQDQDFLLNDIMVRTIDNGEVPITVTIQATLGDSVTTKIATRTVGGNNTGRWTRQFITRGNIDLRVPGNEFILSLSVPSGVDFQCDYVAAILADTPQGSYRGY